MKIAIDISPLKKDNFLQHRVRGTGFYIENLKKSLLKYYTKNQYIFYTRGEILPSDIDIVHVPYFEPFFLTLPSTKKYKTIITVHDLTPLVFPKYFPIGIKGKLKWEIQKNRLKNADRIITDSESSKKDIIKHVGIPEERITVVYLAAGEEFRDRGNESENLQIKPRDLKQKYNLPEKFVLYVGDVTWNKNLPRLLKAIKKTNIPLVMVGKALVQKDFDKTNPWNQDLMEVQQGVAQNKKIICLGFVSSEDLRILYNIATVFVMPSIYEGFGLPIVEAMTCGLPIITTKEGSLPEVAGNAALYVNAYDEESLSKGISKLFFDKELQKDLVRKGFDQVKKFSWRKTAEATMRTYEKTYK